MWGQRDFFHVEHKIGKEGLGPPGKEGGNLFLFTSVIRG